MVSHQSYDPSEVTQTQDKLERHFWKFDRLPNPEIASNPQEKLQDFTTA